MKRTGTMVVHTSWDTPPKKIVFADFCDWGAYVPYEELDCEGCEHKSDPDYCWSCSRHFPDMFIRGEKVVE